MEVNKIICGDALEVLKDLPTAKMIFADPPDNLGLKYDGYSDKLKAYEYYEFLRMSWFMAFRNTDIVWFSIYHKHLQRFLRDISLDVRVFIWRFTFGQHNNNDFGNGYRPIIRWMCPTAKTYPEAIKVPSARQEKYNDKRAKDGGRVPDDVFDYSRVCGTFKERRQWHPTQHPEALIERIVKFSCVPGDLVIDMFAGTGTVNRVCKRLGISCIGIEQSKFYCEKIAEETGALFK